MRRFIALVLLVMLALSPAQAQDRPSCDSFAPDGSDTTYYVGLGNAYNTQGNYTAAIIVYDCAVLLFPDNPALLVNRGLAHAAQQNVTTALADYNRALELDPSLLAAYLNRGALYSRDANYALALADFTVLTSLAPDYAPGYHNRALVHAAEGNYDLALADLEQALALDPAYAQVHRALGALHLALALQSYETYADLADVPVQYLAQDDFDALLRNTLDTADPSVWFAMQTTARGD